MQQVYSHLCLHRLKNMLTLAFTLTLFSCDRIKDKSNAAVDKTKQAVSQSKQKIRDKKNQLIDQAFPVYDNNKQDTENNKKRFGEHLQVDLTPDVKNIYAYGDFLGADYKVLIAFTCNQSTIDKIMATKKMQLTTAKNDNGLFFIDEFKWWNKDKINKLVPYKSGKEEVYWEYLWYDAKTNQAFYEAYSL